MAENVEYFRQILEAQEQHRASSNPDQTVATLRSIEEQNKSIETLAKRDMLLQVAQTYELNQSKKDEDKILEVLENIQGEIKTGLVDTSGQGLNSNIISLIKTIGNQNKLFSEWFNDTRRQDIEREPEISKTFNDDFTQTPPPSFTPNLRDIGDVTRTVLNRTVFPTLKDRRETRLDKIQRDLFSLRGFLNTTGIVKRGTGGVFDTQLARREDMLSKYKSFKQIDPDSAVTWRQFTQQYKEIQQLQREIAKNENTIDKLKKAGYSEDQMSNTKLLEKRETLANKLASVDPTFKEYIKTQTVSEETANENEAWREKQLDVLEKIESNTQKDKALKPADSQQAGGLAGLEGRGILGFVKPIFRSLGAIFKNISTALLGLFSVRKITGLFSKLAGGGRFIGSMLKPLFTNLVKVVSSLFNPATLVRVIGKLALPALIIGSIGSVLIDGFKAWKESGSLSESIVAGLGGLLSFLSFGLFDASTIRTIVDESKNLYKEYIETPLSNLGTSIQSIFKSIGEKFDYLWSSFKKIVSDIHIPAISINGVEITKALYPFKGLLDDNQSPEKTIEPNPVKISPVPAPITQSGDKVYNKSKVNIDNNIKQSQPSNQGSPVIINAPSNVSTSQFFSQKMSPRNNDSSYKRYQQSIYAVI